MSQNTRANEEANRKDALDLVKGLIDTYSVGGYVFRGVNEEYSKQENNGICDGINSILYRKVMEENEGKVLKETLKKDNREFFPAYMEERIVREAQRYFRPNAENLEILTVLQHFGGATNMIDFSRSIYIALFFACQGTTETAGEFIALNLNKAKSISMINYESHPEKGTLEIIAPAYSQDSDYRVNFQGSIFVRPSEGYIAPEICEIKTVCKYLKKHILQYLKNVSGITSNNIYNDFHGFIATQENFLKRNTNSYLARAHYFNGNLKESIAYSDKNISLNPDESYADYNERGITHTATRDVIRAIEDFSKSISLKHDFAEAYSNLGVVYNRIRQYTRAIEHLNKAISLKPNLYMAYNNRGICYKNLRQYDRAIRDYDKAISINPNHANSYFNRGLAKKEMGDEEGAKADFAKAKELDPKIE